MEYKNVFRQITGTFRHSFSYAAVKEINYVN